MSIRFFDGGEEIQSLVVDAAMLVGLRNVAVGRPGDMHPLGPGDLGDVTEATEPPGRKWVSARAVTPYSEEEVRFDIAGEADAGTVAAVVGASLLAGWRC